MPAMNNEITKTLGQSIWQFLVFIWYSWVVVWWWIFGGSFILDDDHDDDHNH